MPADTTAQSTEFLAKLQTGQKLAGCYLLQKQIEGTAGALWLAHDEVLGKDISLLFLPAGILARSGVAERLRQEVKRARQIVHPRILRVHDLIEEEEWSAIAMDTFKSRPLSAVIAGNARGYFEVADVWPLARELCSMLDDAHRIRVVHGGLSPEDVLVGDGEAKVMNFGVSACLRDASEDKSKAAFASGQQLAGAAATDADDVFALGALLHTVLAGAPPFPDADRQSAPSISEHRKKLNHRGGDVPQAWENAIASCLAQDPAGRPASCVEIAKQLDPGSSGAAHVEAPSVVSAPVVEEAPAKPAEVVVEEAPPAKVEPPAAEPEPAPTPEPEPPSPRVERRVKSTAAPEPAPAERVDPDELAAKVRMEEAREEALKRGDVADDDVDAESGGGPSMVSVVSILAVTGLVLFILYRLFFSEPPSPPSPSPSYVSTLSTPVATPTPEPITPRATATPAMKIAAATPTPTPMAVATPKPATPMAETPRPVATPDEQKQIETAIAGIKQEIEKAGKELPAAKKVVEDLSAQQMKRDEDLKKAETAAQQAEKAAADAKKLAEDARKVAAAAAEQLAAKKAEVVRGDEALAKLDKDLKDKERALAGAKSKAMAAATPQPAPLATPKAEPAASPDDPRAAFEQKMKELSKVLGGAATPGATPVAVEMAKATTPKPGGATNAADGITNSLGIRLVPVSGTEVTFAIWPTRVRDFEGFAKTTGLKSSLWKDPGFKQTPDHPVVNVSWQEAIAFCKWLTVKEQREGLISDKQSYRLPTDLEWSRAAGLGAENGSTPEARDMGVPDMYPWGKTWPPPAGAGNYTGEETGSDVAIKGYNDGFMWTSPVGSFPANKAGLFDMGGNVWQWCMDSWNAESKAKVLRGASWYNGALKLSLLSSCRVHASADSSTDNYGFRVVLTAPAK